MVPESERKRNKARIISRPTLNAFMAAHPEATPALVQWEDTITGMEFNTFDELRRQINTVDLVNNHLVFNIMGNRFRLITTVFWPHPALYLKEFLTHPEYDEWSQEQRAAIARRRR